MTGKGNKDGGNSSIRGQGRQRGYIVTTMLIPATILLRLSQEYPDDCVGVDTDQCCYCGG